MKTRNYFMKILICLVDLLYYQVLLCDELSREAKMLRNSRLHEMLVFDRKYVILPVFSLLV